MRRTVVIYASQFIWEGFFFFYFFFLSVTAGNSTDSGRQRLTRKDVHGHNWKPPLPFTVDVAATLGYDYDGKLSKDNGGVEEAEEEAAKFRTTSFTNPQWRYCEHHANSDTIDATSC